jgi:pilus assembly protein CpaB
VHFVRRGDDADSIAALPGTAVRREIAAGQPINKESLVAPGDRGFLAAALSPGMRAVTIPVSGLTGVAGFVFPGDRVDLVLTQIVGSADRRADNGPPLKVSETIIRNLRVLATDNRVTPTTDEEGKTVAARTDLVTLEVTPTIAEKISVAQTVGTLSLSLRSLADSAGDVETAIANGTIRIPPDATPEQEEAILARLAAQPVEGRSSYSTGGDVSRFQRRTVPPLQSARTKADEARLQLELLNLQEALARAELAQLQRPRLRQEAERDRVRVNVYRGDNRTEESVGGKK